MAKKRATSRDNRSRNNTSDPPVTDAQLPSGYATVLSSVSQMIADSRRRAAAAVNQELVLLYWQIGQIIVQQQEAAAWGDSVVESLARDLRLAFPDLKGLSRANVFQMRQLVIACREIEAWMSADRSLKKSPDLSALDGAGAAPPPVAAKVATVSGLFSNALPANASESVGKLVQTVSGQSALHFASDIGDLIPNVSWSHHSTILARCESPAERYFYMKMSVRERWSVRELRRQIQSALFLRYMSVRDEPEKCLPDDAESGPLLPFKDHYVLEFLGLTEEHSEQQLQHAILSNLRDFFLEFGRELTYVGEEYPLTVGRDTFRIDLLFFHRRLQCLIAVDLKKGSFQPEYVGKSCFYCAALDEQLRLPHENPSIGLVLCRSADSVQVRLALSAAAEKIGVATYQTALPDERLIQQRLEQLP